ncbi:AbrB family transcriptional regulator [Halalkalibacterium ligniniphilum]|uniref:AbrB family transcriptional regulator n=1 Tax=Halalkalibacterium ligniniphilum TaxID=1134413 RepID=UPI00034ACABB|nr:AbrB family transcriptional regulator [Halalkalibacterium ligniniphilum]
MLGKITYLFIAVGVGGVFSWLQVPAGWLLGSLLAGIVSAFFIKKVMLSDRLFKYSLAMIGGSIGFMLRPEQFLHYHTLLLPFLLTLILTLIGGLLLGRFLKRYSALNANTAFFCCLPGGASEVIALSKEYGADQRIVAAFHTTRITFFVFTIPLVVGLYVPTATDVIGSRISWGESTLALLTLACVMLLTLIFSKYIHFPGGALFFAIGLGFVAHLLLPTVEMPGFVTGIAQGIMGAIIGMRFDRDTFMELRNIGAVSALTLLLYFVMSMGLALVFWGLTPIGWFTSLLSIVPAGAAEMASTATALGIEPAMVATLQMARVLALFLALPFLIKWFATPVKEV